MHFIEWRLLPTPAAAVMVSACGGERIARVLHPGIQPTPPSKKMMPCSCSAFLGPNCHDIMNSSNIKGRRVGSCIPSTITRRNDTKLHHGGARDECRCSHFLQTKDAGIQPQTRVLGALSNPLSCRVASQSRCGWSSSLSSNINHISSFSSSSIGFSRGKRSGLRECSISARALKTDAQVPEQKGNVGTPTGDGSSDQSISTTNGLHFERKDTEFESNWNLDNVDSLQSGKEEENSTNGRPSSGKSPKLDVTTNEVSEISEDFAVRDMTYGTDPAEDVDDPVLDPQVPSVTNLLKKDMEIQDVQVILPTVKENARARFTPSTEQNPEDSLADSVAASDTGHSSSAQLNRLSAGLVGACKPLFTWVERTGHRTGAGKIVARDLEVLKEIVNDTKEGIRETFRIRRWENSSAVPEAPIRPSPIYHGVSGKELVSADIDSLRFYRSFVKGFLDTWQVPLRLPYDSKAVQTYFNRRPHIVVFRLLEVAAAFSGVAFQLLLEKGTLLLEKSRKAGEEDDEDAPGRSSKALKNTLLSLGPTFIKVAQSLSSRPDVIGTKNAKVLSELQDRLPPFPTEDAMAVIEEELGVPSSQVFRSLSSEPVAAASFGQVYRGWTVEGEEVAVKVQRPDLLFSVARDIYVLRLGLAVLRKLARMRSDISVLADELGQGLFGELDYTIEAANSKEFGYLHRHLRFIKVPRTLDHLTRARVLTMEWIDGYRPLDLQLIADGKDLLGLHFSMDQRHEAKQRLDSLVKKGVECSLVQLLETGLMHADPHPGNLLYTEEDILAYLDFGLIVRVQRKHQAAMLAVIAHLINGEWQCLANDFGDLEIIKPSTDRFALRLALERAFGDGPDAIVKNGKPDIQFGQLTGKLWKVALKFRFRLPPYYTLVLRSLVSLEGIAVSVDPNYKVFAAAYPYVIRRLLTDNSQTTRKVLQSLVLTREGELQWDRIDAIMATYKGDALGKTGLFVTSSEDKCPQKHPGDEDMASLLLAFALSSEGGSMRRILLTADTTSLARAFVSVPARSWRRKAASALADMFFFQILGFLGKKSSVTSATDSSNSSDRERILWTENKSRGVRPKMTRDDSRGNLRNSSSRSRTEKKRLWFLLQVLAGRLRRSPLLMLRVSWAFSTILGFAVAVALRKCAKTLCTSLFTAIRNSSSNTIHSPAAGDSRVGKDAVYNSA